MQKISCNVVLRIGFLIVIGVSLILTVSISYLMWEEYWMVCNDNVTAHLQKYSNLFDENTTRQTFGMNEIGYPFGVHGGNIQECKDYVFEQRELDQNEN